jgi:hypothetical protein
MTRSGRAVLVVEVEVLADLVEDAAADGEGQRGDATTPKQGLRGA